jgi:putative lipoic acid-binding regulatory protein
MNVRVNGGEKRSLTVRGGSADTVCGYVRRITVVQMGKRGAAVVLQVCRVVSSYQKLLNTHLPHLMLRTSTKGRWSCAK